MLEWTYSLAVKLREKLNSIFFFLLTMLELSESFCRHFNFLTVTSAFVAHVHTTVVLSFRKAEMSISVCFKINGINVTKVPLKYARQAVWKAKGVVRLYVKKAPRRQVQIYY